MRHRVAWSCVLVVIAGCGSSPSASVEPQTSPPESTQHNADSVDHEEAAPPMPASDTPPPTPASDAPPPTPDTTAPETATASPSAPAPATSSLRWRLLARPAQLTMSGRQRFRLRRQVTNTGASPADAMTQRASFTLNGAPSMELDMAFGNGARESLWAALPPGRTVFDEREMGESLFPAPGQYTLTMTVDGATSTAHVTVAP